MKNLSIGKRIQLLRMQKGMSVSEFARRIGKSRATVYRYESDEIEEMPYTVLVPIAKALDTTPTYLMGFEEEEDTKEEKKSNEVVETILGFDFTDEETKDIMNYIEFILSKRK